MAHVQLVSVLCRAFQGKKQVKTLRKRKEEAFFFFFSPDGNRPIIFRKLLHRISIWTENGTDHVQKVGLGRGMRSE